MIKWIKYINKPDIMRAFSSAWRILNFNKDPILIGGVARSGTSLISAILDANNEIKSFPRETNIFERERVYNSHRFNKYRNLLRFYFILLREDINPTKVRWCEKTPKNLRKLEEIFNEFGENIKIILMIRDGRDVITSFHPGKEKKYYVSIDRWLKDTQETFKYTDNKQVFILPYESLINNFDLSIRKLLNFLDSPYDDKIKEYQKYSSIKKHGAFHGKELTGLYSKSIDKWNQVEHRERVEMFLNTPKVKELNKLILNYTYNYNNKTAHYSN